MVNISTSSSFLDAKRSSDGLSSISLILVCPALTDREGGGGYISTSEELSGGLYGMLDLDEYEDSSKSSQVSWWSQ